MKFEDNNHNVQVMISMFLKLMERDLYGKLNKISEESNGLLEMTPTQLDQLDTYSENVHIIRKMVNSPEDVSIKYLGVHDLEYFDHPEDALQNNPQAHLCLQYKGWDPIKVGWIDPVESRATDDDFVATPIMYITD